MKYYFWVLGCAMNYSDAERIASVLNSLGFQKTEIEKEADIVCVIACSVRQSAVNRIYGKAKEWYEIKKKRKLITILSGCVLEKDRKKMQPIFDIIFEIKDLELLPQVLDITLSRHSRPDRESIQIKNMDSRLRGNDGMFLGGYLSIVPHYESSFRAYVPISTGCNNFCTYCAVPYTRGREKSRPTKEVIDEIRGLVKKGFREITLLGQNVNSYGQDLSSSVISTKTERSKKISRQARNDKFIELIQKIDKIPGKYRVYFYSNHPKDMSEELIKTLSGLKHFPHYIHLPLQSGDNEIIKKMNRHHTQEQYLKLVKKIRKALPNVILTTDIIVGFPGESKLQFEETLKVLKEAQFEMIFSAQFSKRPRTVAAKFDDNVSEEEKRSREIILNDALTKIVFKKNQELIGTVQEILIDEEKKDKFYGRTLGYKVVEIKKSPTIKIGDFVKVKIDSATAWKLIATIR